MEPVRDKELMDKLTAGLQLDGGSNKFDNGGAFMPLHVGMQDDTRYGQIYYLVHYGEQNGDLMADPEMWFLKYEKTGLYYPFYFRNDYVGYAEESMYMDGEWKVNLTIQKDQARFAETWLENIRYQQGISYE